MSLFMDNINPQIPKFTSPREIYNNIRNTNPYEACGPDGKQNTVLKRFPKKAIDCRTFLIHA